MAGLGHNNGPSLEPGQSWRRHVWTKARRDLLPTLPIEVVRLRVKRAAALGLPYKTYAGIRASTGHDLIGFLFSSNALRVLHSGAALPEDRQAVLSTLLDAQRVALCHQRVDPTRLAQLPTIDAAFAAPEFNQSWSAMRDRMAAVIRDCHSPADRFLLVGETAFERDWAEAGRTAGYLSGAEFFGG